MDRSYSCRDVVDRSDATPRLGRLVLKSPLARSCGPDLAAAKAVISAKELTAPNKLSRE